MAQITITNDPDAITAPAPAAITIISETVLDNGTKSVQTLAQATALAVAPGTVIYVGEKDTSYVKAKNGALLTVVVSEE